MSRQLTIRQAAAVQFASKYSNVAVQLVIAMVLARLVTPEEFGLVAVVTVFTNFFALLCDMGLSVGVVQHRELGDEELSGLFLFSAGLAVALAVLFALVGLPAGLLFGGSEAGSDGGASLRSLFAASSPGVFFAALNAVPNGILRRQKRFLAIGVRLVAVNLVTGCAAVAMAFAGAGCYALVAQFVLSCALSFAWNFALSGLRVRRAPVLGPLRAVWGFSSFQMAHGFVNYFCRNMDNLLVGLAFGNAALGFYDKAYRVSGYPVSGFTSVVASVLHPYLADYRDQPEQIYRRFVDLTRAVFAVGVLASACLAAAPGEVVAVLFGEQWGDAAPLLRALSVSVMFQMVTSLTGAVFQSLGATREMFLSAVVNTALTLCAVGVGVASGSVAVLAALVSAAYCLNPLATFYYLVVRAFYRPLGGFARTMAPQLAVAGVMLAVAWCADAAVGAASLPCWPVVPLLSKVGICCVCYAAILAATGQWRYLRVIVG